MDHLHRIIRLSELPSFVGLRRSQIDELIKKGNFPRPVKLSVRRKGWLEHELISWQQARIAERDGGNTAQPLSTKEAAHG